MQRCTGGVPWRLRLLLLAGACGRASVCEHVCMYVHISRSGSSSNLFPCPCPCPYPCPPLSAFPDPRLHGSSYLARLSGSTAEFLSIWGIMFIGQTPFTMAVVPAATSEATHASASGTAVRVESGEKILTLTFQPVLPSWLFFDEKATPGPASAGAAAAKVAEHKVSFTFLGTTNITYHNPSLYNTWNATIAKVEVVSIAGDRWVRSRLNSVSDGSVGEEGERRNLDSKSTHTRTSTHAHAAGGDKSSGSGSGSGSGSSASTSSYSHASSDGHAVQDSEEEEDQWITGTGASVCVSVCLCVSVCVCVYMCVYVCILTPLDST